MKSTISDIHGGRVIDVTGTEYLKEREKRLQRRDEKSGAFDFEPEVMTKTNLGSVTEETRAPAGSSKRAIKTAQFFTEYYGANSSGLLERFGTNSQEARTFRKVSMSYCNFVT